MENATHPSGIQGYRKLTTLEIGNVNGLKSLGNTVDEHLKAIEQCEELAIDKRAMALARTKFQEAFMWASRSVTKPETFA